MSNFEKRLAENKPNETTIEAKDKLKNYQKTIEKQLQKPLRFGFTLFHKYL